MRNRAKHLREQIADYVAYENGFGQDNLLNCGIMGGQTFTIYGFLEKLCDLHERYNANTVELVFLKI